TALYLVADLGLFALGLWLATSGNLAGYLLSQLLFALIFFHNFAILHECGHETCSSSGLLKPLTGHYASLFCFMPYFPWKYIHAEHHSWAGIRERDPTLRAVLDYRESHRVKTWIIQLAWKTWLPLFSVVQHMVLWTYPLMLLKIGRLRGRRLAFSLASVL